MASKLKALIDSEPANAAKTHQQVLDWLNALVTAYVDVSWLNLEMWIAEYNLRPAIENAAAAGLTDAIRTAARHLLNCVAAGQPLYASDARVRVVIATAMPGGAARDALIAMATRQVTRWSTVMPPMDDLSKLYHIGVARNA